MEVDEPSLLLLGPLLLIDALPQVVVVALAALLAVPGGDAELLLHDAGDLAPLADLSHLEQLLEDLIVLSGNNPYLLLPDLAL